MLLCIPFLPGQNPVIGNTESRLVWDPPSLVLPDETVVPLSQTLEIVPGTVVCVRLLPSTITGAMTLGFDAPPDIVIWREPRGEIL